MLVVLAGIALMPASIVEPVAESGSGQIAGWAMRSNRSALLLLAALFFLSLCRNGVCLWRVDGFLREGTSRNPFYMGSDDSVLFLLRAARRKVGGPRSFCAI